MVSGPSRDRNAREGHDLHTLIGRPGLAAGIAQQAVGGGPHTQPPGPGSPAHAPSVNTSIAGLGAPISANYCAAMRIRAISAVMALVGADWSVAPQSVSAAAPNFVSVFIDTPGQRGSIAVVGDSVMLGSAYEPPPVPGWGPSLARLLADRGWGPVHVAAGVGFQAGKMIPNNPGTNCRCGS